MFLQAFKVIPGIVDGIFLPKHPQELMASADFHPVPSIIGVNNDEYGWIIPSVSPGSEVFGLREVYPLVLCDLDHNTDSLLTTQSMSTVVSKEEMDRQMVQAVLQRRAAQMVRLPGY